jgi:hypothetical protein
VIGVAFRVVFRRSAWARGQTRQAFDDFVQQITNALSVLSGDLEHRLEAELMKLEDPGTRATVVDLVDCNHRRLVCRAHDLRNVPIARHDPLAPIHNKHKEIGVSDRSTPAFEHQFVKRVLACAEHAAGVGQLEARALPFRRKSDDVARGPGDRSDDRASSARQTVKKRGFPDIWAADEHNRWKALHAEAFRLQAEATAIEALLTA